MLHFNERLISVNVTIRLGQKGNVVVNVNSRPRYIWRMHNRKTSNVLCSLIKRQNNLAGRIYFDVFLLFLSHRAACHSSPT